MRGRASLDRQQGVEVGGPQNADERGGPRLADTEEPRGWVGRVNQAGCR